MIWFYSQNQKRSSDFFRNVMSCRIELCEKARKNDNKNGIWNGHALSSSYAILFFRDIYWISLKKTVVYTGYTHDPTSSLYRIDGDNYSGMGMYIPNSFTTPKYLLWNNYFKSSIAWYHASGWAETESIWGNWRRMQPVAFYLIPNNRYSGWKYRISGIPPFPPSCLLHPAGLV